MMPKQLVERLLARIQRWVGGEDVQLTNMSTYQDLSVFELANDEHKGLLTAIQESIWAPQAGRS